MYNTGIFRTLFVFLLACNCANAQPVIALADRITTGLSEPLQLINAGDGSGRLFVVEKGGAIKVFDNSFNQLSVFLQVPGVKNSDEQGLLSAVFHPSYSTNGFFYVYYVNNDNDLVLDRYTVSADPNSADENSGVNLITIPHPDNLNHNGGELHFGTDGFLYLSTGDGGGSGDVPNNAQSNTVLLGKILRFNVTTAAPYYTIPPGNPFGNEIYDLGLRNPFRWSFDRQTGDMWIGDVGQDSFEEINFRPAAAPPGENYGWRCYEADNPFNTAGCLPADSYLQPVFFYPTQEPAAAVTGGVVYRGTSFASLDGYYICADFFSGNFYLLSPSSVTVTPQTLSPTGIVDFGEDEAGEVYAVSLTSNAVYQVTVTGGALPVRLINFGATKQTSSSVKVAWQTGMESNLNSFEISRSSNGSSFAVITTQTALNEANGAAYSYVDAEVPGGTHYYRLKILENDGTYSFSQVVRVNMDGRSANWIYPSLVSNGVLTVIPPDPSFNSIEMYSANGILVYRKNISGTTGNITINTGNQRAGLYIVRLVGNSNTLVSRIVVQ